ncbi:MAG TPA: methyltransferase domain-containing protein [Gaiellaceae bacterium]|nr:methyltransferase domain-containing protein [Gaiellaceae bacterium]
MANVAAENLEAQEAWDGVLFDRFVRFRNVMLPSLAVHGEAAVLHHPPSRGDRVLDVGCGFGDETARLAELVGPQGSALGVDIAPRFVAAADEEFGRRPNLRFEVHDVQTTTFAETFDYAFSRFGVMFFANPVAALRNVQRALVPGGRFVAVVWRRREDNPWVYVAEKTVKPLVPVVEETDEPRCGPGPFFMADADRTSTIFRNAGFEDVSFLRCDRPLRLGLDLEEAVAANMALGPAAEAVRLAGDEAAEMRPRLERLLREALRPYESDDGVVLDSSTWVISASSSR